jgi:hypothetical protein
MLDGRELDELAGAQLGQLVDAALHGQGRGVEGPGGALVVLGKGGVEGGAVEEEIELRLPGRASPTVREAIEDIFQDETVVDHEGHGDRAGRGGETAAEGEHDGIGGVGAAIEQLGDGGGVGGGGDPEEAGGGDLWG